MEGSLQCQELFTEMGRGSEGWLVLESGVEGRGKAAPGQAWAIGQM